MIFALRRRKRHLRMMCTGLPTGVRHANFDDELVPRPKTGLFTPNPSTPTQPLSIELSPPLRYTGTRLRPGEQGFRGRSTASSEPLRNITNISKA